jgi:hypothetical protein
VTTARPFVKVYPASGDATALLNEWECTCKITREINKRWTCDLSYPVPPNNSEWEDKSASFVETGRVRVYEASGAYNTFNVSTLLDGHSQDGTRTIQVQGEHRVIADLNREIIDASLVMTGQSVSAILAKLLTYCSTWTAGACTGTNTVAEFRCGWEPVMSALQRLLTAAQCEYDVDEAAGTIKLYREIGSVNYVQVMPERNANGITRKRYSKSITNVVYPVGNSEPPATCEYSLFMVGSYVSGTGVLTLGEMRDHAMGGGFHLVPENDSWNGYYIYFVDGAEKGNTFLISDSTAGVVSTNASETLLIPTGRTLAAGDRFMLVCPDATTFVNSIRAAASIASYGTREGVLKYSVGAVQNLVRNGAFNAPYTSGLCAGWTLAGSPAAKSVSTTVYQYGGCSQYIQGASAGDGVYQSVVSAVGINAYTLQAWLFVVSGSVEMKWYDGVNTYTIVTSGTGWQRLELSESGIGNPIVVTVSQYGATPALFYLDAVQLEAGDQASAFYENSSMRSMWDAAFDSLMRSKDPRAEYDVNFIDLHAIDPEGYPDDTVNIGDYVEVSDAALGIVQVSMRVTATTRDLFRPQMTKYTISNFEA